MATQPMTLQLRYLQTLTEIGVEKNTTIVFPLPMEFLTLMNKMAGTKPPEPPSRSRRVCNNSGKGGVCGVFSTKRILSR